MALRNARRGLRLAGAIGAVVLGSGVMVTNAAALLAPDIEEATTVTLSDDDDAAALFSATGLAPGHPVSGCINVAYEADGYAAFRLHGQAEGSGLARSLSLLVEAGSGSRFGDCTGFRGDVVYNGTLAEFSARHGDFAEGVDLDAPLDGTSRSFRITAEVLDDDSVQGTDAVATFTWEARPAPPPPTTTTALIPSATTMPPTLVVPLPPTGEVLSPTTATAAPSITTSTSTTSTTTATTSTTTAPTVPVFPAAAPTATGRARLVPVGGRTADSLLEALAHGTIFVLQKSAFPGLLLLVAGIFVLAQDRIDRREPKLALAPLHADPDLRFGERVD
jgi:hypothetical protein